MTEDPSLEDDDVALALRRPRPIGLVIGCFLLGGAGAAMYALRAQELVQAPTGAEPLEPDVHFLELRVPDEEPPPADELGSGQRHKGEEGQMGRPTSKNKSGHYAMEGPRDAIPQLARSFDPDAPAVEPPNIAGEGYAEVAEQDFVQTRVDTRSTFSIDVDTASYSNVRRMIRAGTLPPPEAVRIEELVNYFDYDYPQPEGDAPFSVVAEVGPAPWNTAHRLVHIGVQGQRVEQTEVPPRNLVFLVDVSGSMNSEDKLPLLRQSLALLVPQLRAEDRVGIVVYAGASGIVLDSTPGDAQGAITSALAQLESGGSTNGGAGIELAYRVAEKGFIPGGINRVLLATDGDFNVGLTSEAQLHELVEAKRKSGVFLSVLGFGTGNLQDATMELLADEGNGNYAYIDTFAEARKVLVEESGSTLMTIAKDVKIQVEVDPTRVSSFRLVGYDNRRLAHADFTDDRKDAGEIGAGHSVTAIYEVVPVAGREGGELMRVKLRYKLPDGDTSTELQTTIADAERRLADTSDDYRFAAAVAEAGLLLRHSTHRQRASWSGVVELAAGARGHDRGCWRAGFVELAIDAAHLAGAVVDPVQLGCAT